MSGISEKSRYLGMDNRKITGALDGILEYLVKELNVTVAFGLFEADHMQGVVASSKGGGQLFSFTPSEGYEFPLHASGPGKAMLSALDPETLESLLEKLKLEKFTDTTITDRKQLAKVLSQAADQGYALDYGELVPGIHCVSVPIMDDKGGVIGAIWATAPIPNLPEADFERVGKILIKARHKAEQRLTGSKGQNRYMESIIKKAVRHIETHVSEDLSAASLAIELNVGYDWFRKCFKQMIGESPSHYHARLRLEKAKQLLSDTDLLVKEIAEQLGYQTQEYFSASFKKKTGLSPLHYREKNT